MAAEKEDDMLTIMEELITRYPQLGVCRGEVEEACRALIRCFSTGHKLLVCGNGGSCADAEHIVGELMKGFLKKRPLSGDIPGQDEKRKPVAGGRPSGSTAVRASGDLPHRLSRSVHRLRQRRESGAYLCAAGHWIGRKRGCSSGHQHFGQRRQCVRGRAGGPRAADGGYRFDRPDGGKLKGCSDICIVVPEKETFKIQELHLPVYHALCAAAEAHFFAE